MDALLVSTLTVALAEIGDKTQLLALMLAARYRRPAPIIAGIVAATLVNHALSAWLGAWLASVVSPAALRCVNDLVRVAQKLGADERGAMFDAFGVIDAELAFALMRVLATGHALPPAIEAYVRAVWARPSMRAFADHARPPNPPMNG